MKTKLLFLTILTLVFSLTAQAQTATMDYAFDGDLTGTGGTLTPQGTFAETYEADRDGTASSAITFLDLEGDYLLSPYTGVSGTGARTVMAWVKSTYTSVNPVTIVSWGDNASGNLFDVTLKGGGIRVQLGSSESVNDDYIKTANDVVPRSDENWYHVAVTLPVNGTIADIKMYINGILQASAGSNNPTLAINTTASQVAIGQSVGAATNSNFKTGAVDDVRIYDTELTAEEIFTAADISGPPPVAEFSASNLTPAVGDIVTFTDASSELPTTWAWDFGDATAVGDSTAQNPQVAYQTPGTYTVTLTATNAVDGDDEVKTDYITVSAGTGSGDLQAQYDFDNSLTDASTYGRDLVAVGAFSAVYEADHSGIAESALTTSGVFEDHLVTGYPGIGGDNARTVTAWFNVTGASREPIVSWGMNTPGAMFNVMISGGVPRIEGGGASLVTEDADLTGTWHHIAVTFDPINGDKLSNCKIYVDGVLSTNKTDAAGSYQSETTIINTDISTNLLKVGSAVYSTYTFHGAIDDVRIYSRALTAEEVATIAGVTDPATPPVADFSASNLTPTVGETITFTDASTESPTSWAWDFGDVTATGDTDVQNPQVVYNTAGTYTVTLTVTNDDGSDEEVKTDYITVAEKGVGVNDATFGADELMVYPTLVSDYLTITSTLQEGLEISVYNISGAAVSSTFSKESTSQVNMSGLPNGIYIVKVKAGNKISNTRIIKN